MDFIGAMIAVFGVIAIILAIVAIFTQQSWPCFFEAIVTTAFWGLLLYVMYRIALAVGCLLPGGGPPPPSPSSSSSPLTGSSGRRMKYDGIASFARSEHEEPVLLPLRGIGDAVARATSAFGIRPCPSCHERAAQLNALVPFSRGD
jgi:hypothetical protein